MMFYSDSNIVLACINYELTKLVGYVATRIIKMHNCSSNFKWFYINSKENPADGLSRGVDPQKMP